MFCSECGFDTISKRIPAGFQSSVVWTCESCEYSWTEPVLDSTKSATLWEWLKGAMNGR